MDKEKQKQLIIEIMNEDAKDGLYKKQTAVEWLASKLKDFPHIKHSQSFKELVNEAKEMEKQQLEDAWYAGDEDGAIHEFEYYYNEKYRGNK